MGATPQLIPLPTVQWDVDIFWPPADISFLTGAAFQTAGLARYGGGGVPALWGGATGAGTNNISVDPRGMLVGQFVSNGAGAVVSRALTGFQCNPVLLAGGPVGMLYPSRLRVFRWQFVVELQLTPVVPSAGNLTFVGFCTNAGATPDQAGNGYFGLALGVDGTWHWVTRTGAVLFGFTEDIAGVLPQETTPHLVDIVILSATGSAPGQVQLYLDGAYGSPYLVRSWGVGSVLPLYATAAAINSTAFVATVATRDPATAMVLQVGAVRLMQGQFLPNGSEIY